MTTRSNIKRAKISILTIKVAVGAPYIISVPCLIGPTVSANNQHGHAEGNRLVHMGPTSPERLVSIVPAAGKLSIQQAVHCMMIRVFHDDSSNSEKHFLSTPP